MVFHPGAILPPKGQLAMYVALGTCRYLETFFIATTWRLGVGVTGFYLVEASNATKHLIIYRVAPQTKNYTCKSKVLVYYLITTLNT